jgi:ATP-dependent Clp protease ATP-binding subunit ClpB
MTTFAVPAGQPRQRLRGYPDWALELDARLPVSPQIVLNGNVEDLHVVDGKLPLLSTARVAGNCLLANGFAAVVVWDVVTGLSSLPGSDAKVTHTVPGIATGIHRPNAADLEAVMAAVVGANARGGARIGLVVSGAPRLAPDANDAALHAMYVAARGLLRTAPGDRVAGDRREHLYNTVVWIVDREADLPHWLISADGVPVVSLPLPEMALRTRVAALMAEDLPGYATLSEEGRTKASRTLAELTQGMPLSAMRSSVLLAMDHQVPAADVQNAVRLFRSGLSTSPWDQPETRATISNAAKLLNDKVIDQPAAVRAVADILARAAIGLSGAQSAGHPSRPQGVMFFAGPTGVGKTLLAKQIAQLVFGRQEAMQRFDMSEFASPHSEARLIGAPPGYVGHDAGGELTNAVRQRPFSVLLFDEIEKADPRIMDKFLQILEDGRLTDGSGSTVHFTETLIVFTTNLGIYQDGKPIVSPGQFSYDKLAERVRAAVEQWFLKEDINRPELLNRIGDNIVVFDFISPDGARKILVNALDDLAEQIAKRNGVNVSFDREVLIPQLAAEVAETKNLAFGGRRVTAIIESHVINPLSRELIAATPGSEVTVRSVRGDDTQGYHLETVWARG